MTRALIIEDEHLSAQRVRKMVEEFSSMVVVDVLYSVASAQDWLRENKSPDIIFLDIQLGDGTGFDILDNLKSYPYIIFTTAFDQYTLKAFKYNSVDYLLKPIKPEELEVAIKKYERIGQEHQIETKIAELRKELFRDFKHKFLIRVGQKYRSIPVKEIAYFYSVDGTTYIKTEAEEALLSDYSLNEIEDQLDPASFFRVNRQVIVKEDHIKTIDSFFNGRLILELNPSFQEEVIVSRPKVKLFKKWLDS